MIITFFKRLFRYWAVKDAVNEANRWKEVTKKQMFVIQIYGKIRVYDRQRTNALIDAGALDRKLNHEDDLKKFCIYHTK